MKPTHILLSLVITILVTGCLGLVPALSSAGGPPAPGAEGQFQASLEELNEGLAPETWEQFFHERGAQASWQQLQELANETQLTFSLEDLQLDQAGVADEVGAGIIRYLAYYYPNQIYSLDIWGQLFSENRNLTTLDPAIGELKSLKTLDLSYNQLRALPEEIGNLVNLKELHLFRNQLEALPEDIKKLTSLQTLDLSCNKLRIPPKEIAKLTSLQWLHLSYNKMTCLSERLLPWFQQIERKSTNNHWLRAGNLLPINYTSLVAEAKKAQQSVLKAFREQFVYAATKNLKPLCSEAQEMNQSQLKNYHEASLKQFLCKPIIKRQYQWQEGKSIVYFEQRTPFYLDRQLITEQDVQDMLNDLAGKQCYWAP
ncbi:MAG: leucine-rich repeat domain-containing protein [Bacteroidota bacterium]